MTLKELREEAWSIAREVGTDDSSRYWTSAEMNRYINRTYYKFARETKCIRDSITQSICKIQVKPPADIAELTTLAASDSWYAQDLAWYNGTGWLAGKLVAPYTFAIDGSVLSIDEVKWTNKQWKLLKVSVAKWQTNPWWEQVVGMPTEYCVDYDSNRLTINYRATDDDTLRLVVRRLPLAKLVKDADTPEFKSAYHELLLNGILAQMYQKQDSETFNLSKAQEFEAKEQKDIDDVKNKEYLSCQTIGSNGSLAAFR